MTAILCACALVATTLAASPVASPQGGPEAVAPRARSVLAPLPQTQTPQRDDGVVRQPLVERIYLPGSRDGDRAPPESRDGKVGLSIFRQAVGLSTVDGQLSGGGRDYEVRFDRNGITYVPALGPNAARTFPLRFELTGFGRRSAAMVVATPAEPVAHERLVRYARRGCEERYEIRPAGVEQSYVFATLPPGSGDLVVRGRLMTDLPVAGVAADELRFEVDGLGGVRIGAITGVDANGARAPGTLRFADGDIELSLPAEFVDRAALPLVLDPLIGTSFDVNTFGTNYDDADPDVAYDDSTGLYLVVWKRTFSGTNVAVRGQLVTAAGGFSGGFINIRQSVVASYPRVANVSLRDTFVVVWQENNDILATGVTAVGTVLNVITVAGGGDFQMSPDVGGEATSAADDAIAVWLNWSQSRIQAAQVAVSVGGVVSSFGTTDISNGSYSDAWPAISQSGGASGRHLIVWERYLAALAESDIRGEVIDRNISLLYGFFAVASSDNDEDFPAVDGDGTNWVVAYQTEVDASSGDNDVACRGVSYDVTAGAAYLSAAEVIVEGDINDDELNPSVALIGDSYLIGFADEITAGSGDYDAYVHSVDAFTCLSCEGEGQLELGSRDSDFVMIASQRSGGSNVDEALVVWESRDTAASEGDVLAWRFRGDDGLVVDVGGGCSVGGVAAATCAITGHSGFALRLRGAAANATATLVLAPDRLDMPCGTCTLVPNPFLGFVFSAGNTDSRGNASVDVPIPGSSSLKGVLFYEQWLVSSAGSPCLNHALSNALQVLIQ